MLRPETVGLIEKLLAEGCWSHRQIAIRAEVSRFTVRRIARGQRAKQSRCSHKRPPKDIPDWELEARPVGRCPGCGALVELPCRACRVRARMTAQRRPTRRVVGRESLPTQVGEW